MSFVISLSEFSFDNLIWKIHWDLWFMYFVLLRFVIITFAFHFCNLRGHFLWFCKYYNFVFLIWLWTFCFRLRFSFWCYLCYHAICCYMRFFFSSYIFNWLYGLRSSFRSFYGLLVFIHIFHAFIGYRR
jgi:hypothetical protein